jgi:hypothetical protein
MMAKAKSVISLIMLRTGAVAALNMESLRITTSQRDSTHCMVFPSSAHPYLYLLARAVSRFIKVSQHVGGDSFGLIGLGVGAGGELDETVVRAKRCIWAGGRRRSEPDSPVSADDTAARHGSHFRNFLRLA